MTKRFEMRTFADTQSSNVKAVTWDDASQSCLVQFANGSRYQYDNVTVEDYEALLNSESLGHEVHQRLVSQPKLHPYKLARPAP